CTSISEYTYRSDAVEKCSTTSYGPSAICQYLTAHLQSHRGNACKCFKAYQNTRHDIMFHNTSVNPCWYTTFQKHNYIVFRVHQCFTVHLRNRYFMGHLRTRCTTRVLSPRQHTFVRHPCSEAQLSWYTYGFLVSTVNPLHIISVQLHTGLQLLNPIVSRHICESFTAHQCSAARVLLLIARLRTSHSAIVLLHGKPEDLSWHSSILYISAATSWSNSFPNYAVNTSYHRSVP
ncbi:hypothetical protein SK128_021755, partial [Halocaridina rubra]